MQFFSYKKVVQMEMFNIFVISIISLLKHQFMEKKKKNIEGMRLSGFVTLFIILLIVVFAIWSFTHNDDYK